MDDYMIKDPENTVSSCEEVSDKFEEQEDEHNPINIQNAGKSNDTRRKSDQEDEVSDNLSNKS